MKVLYFRNTCLVILCLFLNSFLMAQDGKITSDKIASFSDPRVPDKLIKTIKDFNINFSNENISPLKGSTTEIDTVFYNLGTIRYKWDINFDSISGKFTGNMNQTAYIKENNSRKKIKTIENNYMVDIQEELYCCIEKPDTCCLWTDRKKYPGCTWAIKTTK